MWSSHNSSRLSCSFTVQSCSRQQTLYVQSNGCCYPFQTHTVQWVQLQLCEFCREESTMQGAAIVLRTLVPNARRIFSIIADQQMQEPEQGMILGCLMQPVGIMVHPWSSCVGMGFQRLFKMCREQFLVSSEMTLRSHVTEFKDHQLVQMR